MADPAARTALRLVPWLLMGGLVLWGYVDLKLEIQELRVREAVRTERGRTDDPDAATPPTAAPAASDTAAPSPIPSREDWSCQGSIAPDMVREAVGQSGRLVFECYRTRLADRPDLAGTLVLELLVGADGAVRASHVTGTLQDESVTSCAGNAALAWHFPPPAGGECAIVAAPFRLEPDAIE